MHKRLLTDTAALRRGVWQLASSRGDEADLIGEDEQLAQVARPELGQDAADVCLGGERAENSWAAISSLRRPAATRLLTSR